MKQKQIQGKRKIHVAGKDFITLPNILCYVRILLVPLFMYLYLVGDLGAVGIERNYTMMWLGVSVIAVASVTDYADGQIARRCNMITDLGKFLDPLADKLMQLAIVIVVGIMFQGETGLPYIWILLAIFVLKEFTQFVAIIALFKHGKYMNGAKWFGKVATFGFDVVMICLLMMPLFDFTNINVWIIMVVCSGSLLIFSWVMYIIEVVKMWNSPGGEIPDSLYKEKGDKND